MIILRKYNTASVIYFPVIKRSAVDQALSTDWTPAAGDTKLVKDGAAAASATTTPFFIAMGNGGVWGLTLGASDLSCAKLIVNISDAATKAIEDQCILIETFGHASGQFQMDLNDSVRLGLTALPNAAAEAAGGLYTRGSGAGQINQPANGQIDANTVKVGGTTQTARDLGASVLLSSGTGTGQLDFTNGVVKANLAQILGTALTETAGYLAAGFKKFFNVATPTGTVNSLPDAVAGAASGLAIVGSNMGTVSSVTGNVGGNVTGSVGSLATQAKADVNGEVVDALNVDTYSELSAVPSATPTIRQMIHLLFMGFKNKVTTTGTQLKVHKDDSTTVLSTQSVSDDGTTFTKDKMA